MTHVLTVFVLHIHIYRTYFLNCQKVSSCELNAVAMGSMMQSECTYWVIWLTSVRLYVYALSLFLAPSKTQGSCFVAHILYLQRQHFSNVTSFSVQAVCKTSRSDCVV